MKKKKTTKALYIAEDDPDFHMIRSALIEKIEEEVSKLDRNTMEMLSNIAAQYIENLLDKNGIEPIRVYQRVKEKKSIVDKVVRKIHKIVPIIPDKPIDELLQNITLEKIKDTIFDLIGIRVILKNEKECYTLLKLLKTSKDVTVVQKESNDYIKHPKANGYQAIHVIVKGKKSKKIFEVQIMSISMERNAEIGEANRLQYRKQKGKHFFRNIALLAATVAATGGIFYSIQKKKKKLQKKRMNKK